MRSMVTLLVLLASLSASRAVGARVLQMHVHRVIATAATLDDVHVRLEWPEGATTGNLTVTAAVVDAADLGYRYRDLRWQCPLKRTANAHWICDGDLRSGVSAPLRLGVDFGPDTTKASLMAGNARFALARDVATPVDTRLDLTRVPLAWAQALLSKAWPAGRLTSGTLDGQLAVHAPTGNALQVTGTLVTNGAAFDTPDATLAGEQLGGRFDIEYGKAGDLTTVRVDGALKGGAFLAGNAYVALPDSPVVLGIEARQRGATGWQLPVIAWRDGDALVVNGSAAFDALNNVQSLTLHAHSRDVAMLPSRYLSGWLAIAGLSDLQMHGAADADGRIHGGQLQSATLALHGVDLADAKGRFSFKGLEGAPAFSAGAPVSSQLRWSGGELYGLAFGASNLALTSRDGELRLPNPVIVPALGGSLQFEGLSLRPPAGDNGTDIHFGLNLDGLDIGQLAKSMGWPAFQGQLTGRIPNARYTGERLVFDGGLKMQLFGGTVQASSLSLERPFGVAPSLTADLALDNIDLQSLTGVFDFGSITGRLDGRIDALRLVDWSATAFDAELHTVKTRGVKQRISQRAVQNISSVGDASFTSSLQSQLIGLFNDFGYSRIGISCRLANEICAMGGLNGGDTRGSEQGGFTIVDGAGIPHLRVVGFNRLVDWPTLVERLAAASSGDVKPVVE